MHLAKMQHRNENPHLHSQRDSWNSLSRSYGGIRLIPQKSSYIKKKRRTRMSWIQHRRNYNPQQQFDLDTRTRAMYCTDSDILCRNVNNGVGVY